MMEKLSADEFDRNYEDVTNRFTAAVKKSGRANGDVILLAATKTVDTDTINYAIKSGIEYIGENKVQELLSKKDGIVPVHNHFIGHLQTNKVRDIINKVEMIESVDSIHLAKEISKQAVRLNLTIDILLEVNIGLEESKSGFLPENVLDAACEIAKMQGISIKGLMAIPPICNKPEENRKFFRKMYNLFIDISQQKIDNSSMNVLSMGMSDDFEVAIEEGATLVRVGTALFGKRIYKN